MTNELIHKLLTSNLEDDMFLGYEYFTHKFLDSIRKKTGRTDETYYMNYMDITKLLGRPVALNFEWSKEYIDNYERDNNKTIDE